MSNVNRCAVSVRRKQLFADWINGLRDDQQGSVTMEELNQEPSVYLLPQWSFTNERDTLLEEYYDLIWEWELSLWYDDEDLWPSTAEFQDFLEWFDVEFHSFVTDLVDEPIDSGAESEDVPPEVWH